MLLSRTLTVCTFTTCALLSLASAQTMMSPTKSASGPGAGTGSSGAPGSTIGAPEEMDLPIQPPTPQFTPTPTHPPEEPPGEDPRDTPAPVIYGEEISSENDTIFYVLDISYSMVLDRQPFVNAEGQTSEGRRIDRAKAELIRSIMGLAKNFSFNIIAYDCATRRWKQGMQEASVPNKSSAVAWTMALKPTGATGTGPATALALGDKDNMAVVLLTDGAPNCGATGTSGHRTMISTANTQGATINVFGIAATGTYRAFCQGVAGDSGGSYFDVP